MSARHIALISFALERGGAERVLTEMAGYFASAGRRVSLLTLDGTCVDAYPVHPAVNRVRLNILWPSRYIWNSVISTHRRQALVRRTIATLGADVVISFIDGTNVRVLAALAGTRIPVIVSERVNPTVHRIGLFWRVARRVVYPIAAAVVVQTDAAARWARRLVRASRVTIIPNAVRDLRSISLEPRPSGMPKGPVMMAMGRLDPQKGFDLLIRAFASIAEQCKDWQLVILGDGGERETLGKLAGSLGLAERISFAGRQENPAVWLKHASLFVLPSRFEGFPNALLEAMQCGLPPIAFDCVSGPSEIIRDGIDGVLVPREDVPALARAIERLALDADLRSRLARRAVEVAERFPPRKIYDMWLSLCDRLAYESDHA